ncbi:hypothetical protein [Acetobacterium wieringae]|uniref:hypothetical protein n=1 Tax=Acetobacterium wieringae TaxID=52694 RepID=UPI0026EFE8B7|nr:hypothetical protein [Acetobacterium wieringae]
MSLVQNIIETYNLVYQVKKDYPLEIIVTTDLYHERQKLANTKCDQAIVAASRQELEDSKKLLVLPDEQDHHYYLLLHEDLFDESQQYCQAVAYEYSRLIDYADIQEKYQVANLRAAQFPDSACFLFLAEVRAWYRGFNLYYNLISAENKAVLFSYLCGTVPEYESVLSFDPGAHMQALAEFYGQALAISAYVNFDVSLPDYLNRHHVHELLAALHDHIDNLCIFENYETIHEAYEDFVQHKSKDLQPHVHSHCCNHNHRDY